MQGKWPEKKEYKGDTDILDSRREGWNFCHDAFMKVINEKPELVPLDENEIKEMIHDRTHYTEECSREIAQNICSKFGQPKQNVPSVEEIICVLKESEGHTTLWADESQVSDNDYMETAQAIHNLLVRGE